MTNTCHNWMDHDPGKVLLEHMRRSLNHSAHFLMSQSPCFKDRAGPEEGRGGWLADGPACHPRLGSFIVKEVIEGEAQRPFGCD